MRKIKRNMVIHCATPNEARELVLYFKSLGYRDCFYSLEKPIDPSDDTWGWDVYKTRTVYYVDIGGILLFSTDDAEENWLNWGEVTEFKDLDIPCATIPLKGYKYLDLEELGLSDANMEMLKDLKRKAAENGFWVRKFCPKKDKASAVLKSVRGENIFIYVEACNSDYSAVGEISFVKCYRIENENSIPDNNSRAYDCSWADVGTAMAVLAACPNI